MKSPATINSAFAESTRKHPEKTALMHKANGSWQRISYKDLSDRVREMAAGLRTLGIEKGDRVALLAENRPEWAVTDLAALAIGGINVPVYTTLPSAQILYILKNSGAKAIVLSDAKQLQKVLQVRDELPELQAIVTINAAPPENDPMVHKFSDVLQSGATSPLTEDEYTTLQSAVTPDDVASIVYTSGTTGDPKGAMLTHGSFLANFDAALMHFAAHGEPVTSEDMFLSFLPLSHVFERTTGHYLPLRAGATIAYAESVFALVGNMADVQPTIMVNVPRVYEAMQEKILETVAKAPARRQAIFEKALQIGRAYSERRRAEKFISPLLRLEHAVMEKLVYATLRERFGGRIRFFVSGGAALNAETARFFDAIGVLIVEGYGMTESSPVISVNSTLKPRFGTVGLPLPGVETRIADDGEILVRGDNLMKGYWNNTTATAEMIDADGWLHTGDIGELSDGYLQITDRKKDLIVLANGKNVAPQPIESAIKQSPLISEVVLIGDGHNIITALIVPSKEKLRDWAKENNVTGDADTLLQSPEVRKKLKQEIDAHSTHLADFEKIKKFAVLPTQFSVETGELTPSLKVKRKVVAQKYAGQIAELRGEQQPAGKAAAS